VVAAGGVHRRLAVLGVRTLVPPDEGRYAEMAREMFASGDWITTRLNGIKYFRKAAAADLDERAVVRRSASANGRPACGRACAAWAACC
jgi:hypothetical protein